MDGHRTVTGNGPGNRTPLTGQLTRSQGSEQVKLNSSAGTIAAVPQICREVGIEVLRAGRRLLHRFSAYSQPTPSWSRSRPYTSTPTT